MRWTRPLASRALSPPPSRETPAKEDNRKSGINLSHPCLSYSVSRKTVIATNHQILVCIRAAVPSSPTETIVFPTAHPPSSRGPQRGAHLEGVVILLELRHRTTHRRLHNRRCTETHLVLSAARRRWPVKPLKRSEEFWAAAIPCAEVSRQALRDVTLGGM